MEKIRGGQEGRFSLTSGGRRFLIGLGALLIFSCAIRHKPPGPHENYGARAEQVIKDIPYATGVAGEDMLKLDVYSNPHEGLLPAVVMIHGGGWMGGDKEMDNKVYLCKVLANNGYVVFSINYRLAPKFPIQKQIEDAMSAVIWVKEHAKEYGADPNRIGVVGGSAGGHLAAMVAWASDDDYFQPTARIKTELDSEVKVAALYYPVIDLERTLKERIDGIAGIAHLYFTGKSGKEYQELLKHISPINHLDKNCVPTIILTGDADELKLYPQSVEAVQKLKDLGIDAELFTARGKKHGFTWEYWDPVSVDSAMAVVKFFDRYLKN